jgi:hypothetical protein
MPECLLSPSRSCPAQTHSRLTARVDVGVRKRGRHATLSISVFGASLGYLFAALTSTIMIMLMMKSHTNHNTAQHSTHTIVHTRFVIDTTKYFFWYFQFHYTHYWAAAGYEQNECRINWNKQLITN